MIQEDSGQERYVGDVVANVKPEAIANSNKNRGDWFTRFGDLAITWTEPMTVAEFSELEEFVAIWLRGVKRRVLDMTERDRCIAIAECNAHEDCDVAEQIIRQIRSGDNPIGGPPP